MIASGGGARSPLWLEIKAAAYNLPILSTRNQENGVTGCGIIAGVGVGLYADFASGVRQTVQFDKVISPDPRLRDYYHACSELFDTLSPAIRRLIRQAGCAQRGARLIRKGKP